MAKAIIKTIDPKFYLKSSFTLIRVLFVETKNCKLKILLNARKAEKAFCQENL
jgi:hypothetical protein